MKKQEAINLFGSKLDDLGRVVGRTRSAISQWPDDLDDERINLVIGAAIRLGVEIPDQLFTSVKRDRRISNVPHRRGTDANRRASDATHKRRTTDQL